MEKGVLPKDPKVVEETLIFLDIDGVLNVGIQDSASSKLPLFNEANFSIARKLLKGDERSDAAEMLLSVMRMHTLDGNSSTYGDFLSRNDLDVCDIFVHRLVKILRAAGENVRVVISSSWRKPPSAENKQSLEKIISGYLGKRFRFHDHTALVDEVGGHDRLRLIGDYIEMHCSRGESTTRINMLVLDDFYYMPISGFDINGTTVESLQSAESYLESRAPPSAAVKARIIHTYITSSLPSGLEVHIGTGISLQHLSRAMAFLGARDSVNVSSPEMVEDIDVLLVKQLEPMETLIFLDIDGVLNVGIDSASAPLSVNEANCSVARKLFRCDDQDDTAEMLIAVMRMYTCDGNSSRYGDFLSRNDLDVCDIFVHRLVNIIRASGEKVRVIISSSWRRPKYAAHVQSLEKMIGGYLGKTFNFFDRTSLEDESGGHDRIRIIGDYIEAHCKKEDTATKINVLVLDDFFYKPISNFDCGGITVNSLQSAESYLEARTTERTNAKVRIIHTFVSSLLPSGSEVQIGTGLSLQHLSRALGFLGSADSLNAFHAEAAVDVDASLSKGLESVETLIFLDIDGVLNVGIADPGSAPLSFNEDNFSIARKLFKCNVKNNAAEMLLGVMRMHTCDGNSSTYGDFLSRNDLDVCDIFIHRLVKIIRAAGENAQVIISSSWRRPKYATKLRNLEKMRSGYLGETFKFDGCTRLADEIGGHDRLALIGDFIEKHCGKEEHSSKVRFLVLDDFFYLPLSGFHCGDTVVNSVQSAESYLQSRAPPSTEARVRIIHTYMSSLLPSGLEVKVGTGLSLQHLGEALAFLAATRSMHICLPEATEDVDAPPPQGLDAVETLIFLDIDGVLNVSIADPGSKQLSFNEANYSSARRLVQGSEKNDIAEMLIALMRMQTCDGNSSTYGDFLSRNDLDVCDIFIHRLVKIIRASGEKVRVIISSSWRRPQYAANVQSLEQIIGGYLGKRFEFYDRTEIVDETGGPVRLRLIGNYVAMHCSKDEDMSKIRVLVLDDFFYLPISGFNCGGTVIDSLRAAESYLQASAPSRVEAGVKIIHTYTSSVLPSGIEVQVGTGLSLKHLKEALVFLGAMRGSPSPSEPSSPARRAGVPVGAIE